MKLLLHGCNRHDPLMSFLQMTPRFFRFHGPRFHHPPMSAFWVRADIKF
jgi:hypothetical protein